MLLISIRDYEDILLEKQVLQNSSTLTLPRIFNKNGERRIVYQVITDFLLIVYISKVWDWEPFGNPKLYKMNLYVTIQVPGKDEGTKKRFYVTRSATTSVYSCYHK